jgi:hypothetical protein
MEHKDPGLVLAVLDLEALPGLRLNRGRIDFEKTL